MHRGRQGTRVQKIQVQKPVSPEVAHNLRNTGSRLTFRLMRQKVVLPSQAIPSPDAGPPPDPTPTHAGWNPQPTLLDRLSGSDHQLPDCLARAYKPQQCCSGLKTRATVLGDQEARSQYKDLPCTMILGTYGH